MSDDYSEMSLFDMFRMEAETQAQVLTEGLLALENDPDAATHTEACMRAAHSLKGAARIVGMTAGVNVAHVMEDCFVAAQKGQIQLRHQHTDVLLRGVDLLNRIANTKEADIARWETEWVGDINGFLAELAGVLAGPAAPETVAKAEPVEKVSVVETIEPIEPAAAAIEIAPAPVATAPEHAAPSKQEPASQQAAAGMVRITSENLNRLLGLAGESLVESRWLKPFSETMLAIRNKRYGSIKRVEAIYGAAIAMGASDELKAQMAESTRLMSELHQHFSDQLVQLEMFDRRLVDLSHRLYEEALSCRMRPFSDGTQGFPRMVRDIGRTLNKQVRLKISGEATQVDRDLLERLDAPLGHLLRNAVDHGIESPEQRQAAGKPAEGTILLEARHNSGLLQIIVSDDGGGIDIAKIRKAVIERKLSSAETVAKMGEAELLEFLFLPGFTMKTEVTDISGRGVGLDAVQDMMKQVRGIVRVSSVLGKGTQFQLQLPLTLSVMRTMLANVNGEPYALPLAHIHRALKLPRNKIELLEGQQHFELDGRQIGLVTAHQVLEVREPELAEELSIIVVGEGSKTYGLIVDDFIGELELVVHPLDPRLGKVRNITAGALMEDGSPVLIIDVEDMIHSVDKLISGGLLSSVHGASSANIGGKKSKRVLVVDDSLTVRELERKLLGSHGYEVEIAVDGMDGWNAVRTSQFDLVISDVDMPRMDGIEMVTLIKQNPNLKSIPVMVVSYKDREEDRQRGLEAGADYYLTKGSFHDETLLRAVVDLIGTAEV